MIRTTLHWLLLRRLLNRIVSGAIRRVLLQQALTDPQGREYRWLAAEINNFLASLEQEAETLRPVAHLDSLPSFGNRLMVEFAVYTAACDRLLRRSGVAPATAREVVSAMGWDIYRRMLGFASLPAKLVTRDPGRRLRWTIRILLWFPFNAPGAPGYAVDTRVEGKDILTHFNHCPPQTFIRKLSEQTDDPELLETFRQSWCLYDWAGADIIAGDNQRGHYRRLHTLSHGDSLCDMCWAARATGSPYSGSSPKRNSSSADQDIS